MLCYIILCYTITCHLNVKCTLQELNGNKRSMAEGYEKKARRPRCPLRLLMILLDICIYV